MKLDLFSSLAPLRHVLDFHLARHNVLATNLANAETPGFRPRDLEFSDVLQQAGQLTQTDRMHIGPGAGGSTYQVVENEQEPVGPDGNGVRLERAMAQVAANRLRYEATIEVARRRIALLRYAAKDGGS